MAKTNPEAPMIKQGKWKYTWHMMKTNKACYAMLLPFMSLFIIFTVVPVVMSLPMGFTNFNMIETPKFVGLSNFYTLFLNDDVFLIAVRNTLIFAIFTGPFSYILSFIIADKRDERIPQNLLHIRVLCTFYDNFRICYLAAYPVR